MDSPSRSSTVERIAKQFPDEPVGARQVIETILDFHSEYAGGAAPEIAISWPTVAGAVSDIEEYLAWIGEMYRPDAFGGKLHGRAAILGAGLVDRAVGRELAASGLFRAIEDELQEDFESVLSEDGARRYASIPLACAHRRPPIEIRISDFGIGPTNGLGDVAVLAQSRDGRWIAVGRGQDLMLFHGADRTLRLELDDPVTAVAVGPAGRTVLVGTAVGWGIVSAVDGSFRQIDPDPAGRETTFASQAQADPAAGRFAAAAAGSRLFAAIPGVGEVRSLSHDGVVRTHMHDEGPTADLAVSPSGTYVARRTSDEIVSVLDVRSGARREESAVEDVDVFVDDNGRLAYATRQAQGSATPHKPQLNVGTRTVDHDVAAGPALAFSPDGWFIAGMTEAGIALLDARERQLDPSLPTRSASLQQVTTIPVEGHRFVSLTFSGDGHWLLGHTDDGFVSQWEVGSTPAPIPPAPLAYTPDLADGRGDDLMGIDPAVDAFASLISARDLEPPLSVGIFGEWGSGKTFFMRRLRGRIEDRSTTARESGLMQREVSFAKRIVQVEFNAWHYSGGNLWAALVQHIFENLSLFGGEPESEVFRRQRHILDRINERDEERSKLLSERRGVHEDVEQTGSALEELEKSHEERLNDLKQLTAVDVAKLIADDPQLKQKIELLGQDLGLSKAGASAVELYAVLQESRALLRRASPMLAVGEGRGFTHSRIALGLTVLAGPAIAALGALVSAPLGLDQPAIVAVIGGIGALLASGTAWIKKQNDWLRDKIERAERAEAVLRHRERAAEAAYEVERAAVEKGLDELAGRLATVQGEITRVEEERSALQASLEAITPASVLAEYILDRAASDDYRKHLGLHARIKDDFDRIAEIMEQDRTAVRYAQTLEAENEYAERRIDRIVLYIDDLDRCDAEKVVEVLGAVHLLLAFPLFVVVVGIDARWAAQALRDRFPELLSGSDRSSTEASPEDYLEKIFQIPFWLGRLDSVAASQFVTGIVGTSEGGDLVPPEPEKTRGPADGAARAETDSTPIPSNEVASPPQSPGTRSDPPKRPELNPASLQMGDAERAFMRDEVASLLGSSPRAIKRFVNLYRLAKAIASDPLDFVAERPHHGAPCEAVMMLLAIDTGTPHEARSLFSKLCTWRPAGDEPDNLSAASTAIAHGSSPGSAANQLAEWVAKQPRRRELHMQLVRSWAPTIAQFSFRAANGAAAERGDTSDSE